MTADNGFIEHYIAKVNGEPIGCVVLIDRNDAGQTQHVVASYRPFNSEVLFSSPLRGKFAGTRLPSTSASVNPRADRSKETDMRVVKAAAVQLSPVLYSREGTVAKSVRKIHELGQRGVQFATFPETVVPYYPIFRFCSPATDSLADMSTGSSSIRGPANLNSCCSYSRIVSTIDRTASAPWTAPFNIDPSVRLQGPSGRAPQTCTLEQDDLVPRRERVGHRGIPVVQRAGKVLET